MPIPPELSEIEVGDVFIRDSDWSRFMVFGMKKLDTGPDSGRRALILEDDKHVKHLVPLYVFKKEFSPSESDSLFSRI